MGRWSATTIWWLAWRPDRAARRGQALVEFSVMIVVLVIPLFVGLTGFTLIKAKLALGPVAREAARVMAEAPSPPVALAVGPARAIEVAQQAGLKPERLTIVVDAGSFDRDSGVVTVTVRYRAALQGIPLLSLVDQEVVRTARWPVQRFQDR